MRSGQIASATCRGERMEDFQRYLVTTGVLPKEVDVEAYYTEELIPQIKHSMPAQSRTGKVTHLK